MTKQIEKAQARIKKIQTELQQIGSMRPGKISKQKRKDKNGNFYGEYWQLGYTYKMKQRNHYVPSDLVKMVATQNEEFKRFKKLIEEWIDLALFCAQQEFEKMKKEIKK